MEWRSSVTHTIFPFDTENLLPKARHFSQAGFKSQAKKGRAWSVWKEVVLYLLNRIPEYEDEAAARSYVEFIESSKLLSASSVEDL